MTNGGQDEPTSVSNREEALDFDGDEKIELPVPPLVGYYRQLS
jgi:hypothetical protein